MILKISLSRHFEPFTTAQGSRTFSNVAKIRGARGGDVSIERRSFFILGGLILLLCLSLALIYPAARAGARPRCRISVHSDRCPNGPHIARLVVQRAA